MTQINPVCLVEWAELATAETLRYSAEQLGLAWEGVAQHALAFTGWQGEVLKVEDAVMLLWSQQTFPRVVDLAVRGLLAAGPIVLWIPMGGIGTNVLEETLNQGYGPFKPVGMMFPSRMGGRPPLSREQLLELGREWQHPELTPAPKQDVASAEPPPQAAQPSRPAGPELQNSAATPPVAPPSRSRTPPPTA